MTNTLLTPLLTILVPALWIPLADPHSQPYGATDVPVPPPPPTTSTQYDFEELPGVQHEFRVEVGPGIEECFFQRIKRGAQLHLSFEVLRGADRNVDVHIRNPDGSILTSHLWTKEGTTDREVNTQGDYGICVDNTHSRFSAKLVYIYFASIVLSEWEQYTKDLEQFDVSVGNVTESLLTIDKLIMGMVTSQAFSRRSSVTDWYQIKENNAHVQLWSCVVCFLVMTTSGLQVYFVRRLFAAQSVTHTSKQRA